MNRRYFILSAGLLGVALPVGYYVKTKYSPKNSNPLAVPYLLSTFCSGQTLRGIGNNYMLQHPSENTLQSLKDLLLAKTDGSKTKEKNTDEVAALIDQKIKADFDARNVTIMEGWVITKTEARQCAVFSLTL